MLAVAVGPVVHPGRLVHCVGAAAAEQGLTSVRAGGRRLSGGVRRQRLQRGLVVLQVAVSVVLLAGAGLLTRTTLRLSQVPTGLENRECADN